MAFFRGTRFVAWFGHLTRFPKPIMFSAVALTNHLPITIACLATSFLSHFHQSIYSLRNIGLTFCSIPSCLMLRQYRLLILLDRASNTWCLSCKSRASTAAESRAKSQVPVKNNLATGENATKSTLDKLERSAQNFSKLKLSRFAILYCQRFMPPEQAVSATTLEFSR